MIGKTPVAPNKKALTFIRVKWDGTTMTFTGVEGPKADGTCTGSSGQIILGYKEFDTRGDKTLLDIEPAKDWNHAMIRALFNRWDLYHLNSMRAGCEHQHDMGWHRRPIDPAKPLTAYGIHHPSQKGAMWNMLAWVYASEVPGGLLAQPCPICGYKYGTAWKTAEIPSHVIEILWSLPESKLTPAWI